MGGHHEVLRGHDRHGGRSRGAVLHDRSGGVR
ncbi:hypothetical protein PS9374_06276 [Planomonospora sphaerica]|uniref:Uncharacterized protein n=1 Tax=Planomonospora sphaerica TaxID=161355 RepID=A0A171DNE9_9ACTN|nr:hypothetical protein PS9374_06276 [Planomonospora sphaerica]